LELQINEEILISYDDEVKFPEVEKITLPEDDEDEWNF